MERSSNFSQNHNQQILKLEFEPKQNDTGARTLTTLVSTIIVFNGREGMVESGLFERTSCVKFSVPAQQTCSKVKSWHFFPGFLLPCRGEGHYNLFTFLNTLRSLPSPFDIHTPHSVSMSKYRFQGLTTQQSVRYFSFQGLIPTVKCNKNLANKLEHGKGKS